MSGKTIVISGLTNKFLASSVRFMPRKMVTSIVEKFKEGSNFY